MSKLRSAMLTMGGVALAVILTAHAKAEGVKVGEKAPSFEAVTTDGQTITLEGTKGAEAVVLCFTCNNCPVAVAYEDRFIEFTKKYADKGVKFVAINVNVTEDLEEMKKRAEAKQFNFPYAYDESGKSAAAYGARVTPHLFVIDGDGVVAYIGSFDDKMDTREVQEHYVAAAVDALLKGDKPEKSETKAFGCSIKR